MKTKEQQTEKILSLLAENTEVKRVLGYVEMSNRFYPEEGSFMAYTWLNHNNNVTYIGDCPDTQFILFQYADWTKYKEWLSA